jgi:hypothetical protein
VHGGEVEPTHHVLDEWRGEDLSNGLADELAIEIGHRRRLKRLGDDAGGRAGRIVPGDAVRATRAVPHVALR